MATDYFFAIVFVPVLFVIAALVLILVFAKRAGKRFTLFGLPWGAMLTGTLGALAGLFVYSAIASYIEAVSRVAEYESLREQGALSLAAGWSIYLFILLAPFLLAGVAVLLIPILAALSWIRLVSVAGIALVAAICIGINAVLTYMYPGNNWCEANTLLCVQQSIVDSLAFAVPVASGFALAARLPLVRSRRTPADPIPV